MKALSFCHICCTMQISTAQFWVNSSSWYFRIKSIRVLSAENFMCISIMGLDECKFDMFSTWFGILFSVDVNGIVLETKLVLHRLSQFLFSFNLFSCNFDGLFLVDYFSRRKIFLYILFLDAKEASVIRKLYWVFTGGIQKTSFFHIIFHVSSIYLNDFEFDCLLKVSKKKLWIAHAPPSKQSRANLFFFIFLATSRHIPHRFHSIFFTNQKSIELLEFDFLRFSFFVIFVVRYDS